MAALSTTFEPALLKRVKNFSFCVCIRRPVEILLADGTRGTRRGFARRLSVHSERWAEGVTRSSPFPIYAPQGVKGGKTRSEFMRRAHTRGAGLQAQLVW
jgi:hypothetical protein